MGTRAAFDDEPVPEPTLTRAEILTACRELYGARLMGIPGLASKFNLAECHVRAMVMDILYTRTQAALATTGHCRSCGSLGVLLANDEVVDGRCGTCRAQGHTNTLDHYAMQTDLRRRPHAATPPYHRAKLSAAQVAEILHRYRLGGCTYRALCADYHVSIPTMRTVLRGCYTPKPERKLSSRMRQSASEICESPS